EFSADHSLVINAPVLEWGYLQVDDSQGDGNNRIDPGESFILGIPFTNMGHSMSPDIHTTLIVNGGEHLMNPIANDFEALDVNGSAIMQNEITLSSQVTPGTTIQIIAMASMGDYTVVNTYNVVVGILLENFENGFGNYPWAFTGGDWTTSANGYGSTMAAQSATIGNNQSTSMNITMTNPVDGIVSFWKKVSSEVGRDYLKFYINGMLKNQWSGIDENYSQVSYMVAAGTNTYRWEYAKDNSVSAGSDCVWIDDVVFPAESLNSGSPVLEIDQTNLDFGNANIGEELVLPLIISNTGNAGMIGTLQIPAPYSLDSSISETVSFMNYTIPAGETLELSIAFRPQAEGVFAGFLIVTSDDPDALQTNIPLMGSATPVSNNDNVNPVVTRLGSNYPNPFNPNTTLSYSLKERGEVKIDIYNVLGQKVRTLVNGVMNAGTHSVSWNGMDDNRRPVASGVYFYKMQSGTYTNTRKMILMK
ncbi:MAG TPA: T9SS type A sorting domain-containing protein, partial [Candidatus Cloacimonadota bacterium]|nr:T9SS type A sorting domain-containing protein [Candidatus Cloacimonadota bacterium]